MKSAFGRPVDVTPLLEEMAAAVEANPDTLRVLLFDDLDLIDDRPMYEPLQKLLDGGVRCIGSVAGLRGFGQNPLYTDLKAARTMLLLQPEGAREVQEVAGVAADLRPGFRMPVGRGVLVADRMATAVQVASLDLGTTAELVGPATMLSAMPELPTDTPFRFAQPVLPALSTTGRDEPAGTSAMDTTEDGDLTVTRRSFGDPSTTAEHTQESAAPVRLHLDFSTGERVPVETATMIGRRPESHDASASPALALVRLADPLVSSTHLLVQPASSHLEILDQGSLNGTMVHMENGAERALLPGVPMQVEAGTRIRLGDSVITVTSY